MIKLDESIVYNIYLVGTGATGSHFLSFLSQLQNNLKEGSLTLIDGDIVEKKNISNQKFLSKDIGRNKTEVLAERYQSVYPKIKLRYLEQYIKSKEQLKKIILDQSSGKKIMPILIGAVDNNPTRSIFHDVFYDDDIKDMIYIDSGNGTIERNGQIVVGVKASKSVQDFSKDNSVYAHFKRESSIIQKPLGDIFPEVFENKEETLEKVLSCGYISDTNPQIISTNIFAAACLFSIITNILMYNQIDCHVVYFNAETTEVTNI